MRISFISFFLISFSVCSVTVLSQSKIGLSIGLAQYDTPKDIDNNLVVELGVMNSYYASLHLDFSLKKNIASKSTMNYNLGYSYAFIQFGPEGLSGLIGRSIPGSLTPGYQRNAADYRLHYLTVESQYEHYFKERFKGFSISIAPKLFYQIVNKHRRSRWLETQEVIALPIEDKQNGLNKFAVHINLTVAYNVLIKSLHISLGFQNAVRVRSFYSDIPIGNRYFNRGIFLGVHF